MPRLRLVEQDHWQPWTGPEHRCSGQFCYAPAILVGEGRARSWARDRSWTTRRWLCAAHAEDYSVVLYRGRWWYRLSGDWPLRPRPRKETHANVTH